MPQTLPHRPSRTQSTIYTRKTPIDCYGGRGCKCTPSFVIDARGVWSRTSISVSAW